MAERLGTAGVHIGRLIFGTIFVVIGAYGVSDTELSSAWVWAGLLGAAGAAGLAGAVSALMGSWRGSNGSGLDEGTDATDTARGPGEVVDG